MLSRFVGKDRNPGSSGFRSFLKLKRILLILMIILCGALFWYGNQLVLSINPEGKQKQLSFATDVGDVWYIEFIHSVQKTPVQEFFLVRGIDDLLLNQTIYQSLGVGLPFLASEGKLRTTNDGHFVLEMHREFKTIKIRTGVEARPRIYFRGSVFPIYKLYDPGTLVEIKVEKRYKTWFPK